MKRYEIQENAVENTWMIFDHLHQEFLHDDFGDSFNTVEEAEVYLKENYDLDEQMPYDILQRKHDVEGDGANYYLWNMITDRAEQDEDGSVYHFSTYDDAYSFMVELISMGDYIPQVKATAEIKEPLYVVYNTTSGVIARRFAGDTKVLNTNTDKKVAQHLAEMLNANTKAKDWIVAKIEHVDLV